MNKDNIFRSSLFHMDTGDILHILIKDESGAVVTFALGSGATVESEIDVEMGVVPAKPIVLPASDITNTSFTANWSFIENTNGYYFDLATDPDMTPKVAGYDNLDVGLVDHIDLSGLTPAVTYYYQIRAYNNTGTSVNSDVESALTTSPLALEDYDGNEYTTVVIGSQEWIVENLRTTHYADGTVIPEIVNDALWIADVTGAMCYYNNDPLNVDPYGALYNWYAIDNAHLLAYFQKGGVQEVGWRISTDTDMETLVASLGGDAVAGGKLKEAGTSHWINPNTDADNSSGFTSLPGGIRSFSFNAIGYSGGIWTVPEINATTGMYLNIIWNSGGIWYTNTNKRGGLAVRCVRDISVGTNYVEYTDGIDTFRKGVRSSSLVIDKTLTLLGFTGIEGVDWENIKSVG